MRFTESMKEYNVAKNYIGIGAVRSFDAEQRFTTSEFTKRFKFLEEKLGVEAATPYYQTRLPVPFNNGESGGHSFHDWHDRSMLFLNALVRKGILAREGNKKFWYRIISVDLLREASRQATIAWERLQ
jgi:hypothetical protein